MVIASRQRQGLPLAVAFVGALSLPASAAQEPYGQTIQGWRFTQDIVNGMALCRAFSPGPTEGVIIQRRGDGSYVLSVPARNVPRGNYEGAGLEMGREAEMTNARADGNRVYLDADQRSMALIVRHGGFRWAVNNRRQIGDVVFTTALGPAIARLGECTQANGGRR